MTGRHESGIVARGWIVPVIPREYRRLRRARAFPLGVSTVILVLHVPPCFSPFRMEGGAAKG